MAHIQQAGLQPDALTIRALDCRRLPGGHASRITRWRTRTPSCLTPDARMPGLASESSRAVFRAVFLSSLPGLT